ncbi:hypothetical protein JOF41_001874 [Saccharothrix coeruleofusca]|nr:hypothetical protein [Saccharothrix coeruleofusca]MBP2335696.1 hypothetical protein [Saccharothrix coeruleofusca]
MSIVPCRDVAPPPVTTPKRAASTGYRHTDAALLTKVPDHAASLR